MSIYSGFATRSQEQCYDQCVQSLIYIMQRRIIKFYKNEEADEQKFISLVLKINSQLKSMETNKYLDPKSSVAINDLIKFMNVHQKNFKQKNKTIEKQPEINIVPQTLPVVEQKQTLEQTAPKKNTLWVQKKVPKVQPKIQQKVQAKMVDQESQTMGTIYEKKDSPKQASLPKGGAERQAISAFRTKYGQKMSHNKMQRINQYSKDLMDKIKRRSQSHYLPMAQIPKQNGDVKNHLKQVQTIQRRKRKQKYQSRLGIKDIDTQQDIVSEYQVGDIIKEYLLRAKKKNMKYENQREHTNNDF